MKVKKQTLCHFKRRTWVLLKSQNPDIWQAKLTIDAGREEKKELIELPPRSTKYLVK